jgi:DNA-binding ferritin-like protein
MESLYNKIHSKHEEEMMQLSRIVDPNFKAIIAQSYECMAGCYRSPGTLEESNNCSSICHRETEKVQTEVQGLLGNIQKFLQNCMQECDYSHKSNQNELAACFEDCSEQTSKKIFNARKIALEITSKYLR